MEFLLRDTTKGDFECLWKIDQECFPPGISYSRMELAFYMRRPGAFTLVAEAVAAKADGSAAESSRIMGFIVAEASRRGVGHVITIDVRPQVRRAGVGSRLLTKVEERLCMARCRSVYLETAVDNRAAFAFYKRHGYFTVKTVPRYYSNGVDAFVLQKDLISCTEGR